jgi:hypothetical protein
MWLPLLTTSKGVWILDACSAGVGPFGGPWKQAVNNEIQNIVGGPFVGSGKGERGPTWLSTGVRVLRKIQCNFDVDFLDAKLSCIGGGTYEIDQ